MAANVVHRLHSREHLQLLAQSDQHMLSGDRGVRRVVERASPTAHYYYRCALTIRKINCLSSGGIYIRDPGLYTHRARGFLSSKLNSCYNPVSDKLGVFLARTVIQEVIYRLQNLYSVEFCLNRIISDQQPRI